MHPILEVQSHILPVEISKPIPPEESPNPNLDFLAVLQSLSTQSEEEKNVLVEESAEDLDEIIEEEEEPIVSSLDTEITDIEELEVETSTTEIKDLIPVFWQKVEEQEPKTNLEEASEKEIELDPQIQHLKELKQELVEFNENPQNLELELALELKSENSSEKNILEKNLFNEVKIETLEKTEQIQTTSHLNLKSNPLQNLEIEEKSEFKSSKEVFSTSSKAKFLQKENLVSQQKEISNLELEVKNTEVKLPRTSIELLSEFKLFSKRENFLPEVEKPKKVEIQVQNFLTPKLDLDLKPEVKQNVVEKDSSFLVHWMGPKPNSKLDLGNQKVEINKEVKENFYKNLQEIVKVVKVQILENGKNTAKIELVPKELGKMTLHVSLENDRVEGRIFVETELAKSLIHSELSSLKSELKQVGLNLDFFSVDLNYNQEKFLAREQDQKEQVSKQTSSFKQTTEVEEEISLVSKKLIDIRI
jgi:flagellar hook-length control protein FliK